MKLLPSGQEVRNMISLTVLAIIVTITVAQLSSIIASNLSF